MESLTSRRLEERPEVGSDNLDSEVREDETALETGEARVHIVAKEMRD